MPPISKPKALGDGTGPRQVKFPTISVKLHSVATNNPITEDQMKGIMGWEIVEKAKTKKDDYMLVYEGHYIVCKNNAGNRPFYEDWGWALCQSFLKRQWKLNGETMIIGKTGLVLSAQHRGIGFLLACEKWRKAKQQQQAEQDLDEVDTQILELWPDSPPVFEGIIVYGIEEDQATISTLDYNRPRSFGDVLYTSGVFGKVTPSKQEKLCKLLGNAIKLVWERTGMKRDDFTQYLTNSELTDFISHHPRLINAVKHINTENEGKKEGDKLGPIAALYGPGTAAGWLYLMAFANADPEKYLENHPRDEKHLKFSKDDWITAEQFWTNLVIAQQQRCPEVQAVLEAFEAEHDSETGRAAPEQIKRGILVNAFNVFKAREKWLSNGQQGEPPPEMYYKPDQEDVGLPGNIALEKKEDQYGQMRLASKPSLGGIDVLPEEEKEDTKAKTPEELKAEAERIKQENLEKEKEKETKQDAKRKARQDKARKEVDDAAAKNAAEKGIKVEVETKPANNNPPKKPGLKGGL